MVIGPKEAENIAWMKMAPRMAKLEETIDKDLAHAGGRRTIVNVSLGYGGPYDNPANDVPTHMVEALLDNYRMAGWKAEMHHDQREGTYIEFEPRTTRQNQEAGYCGPYGFCNARPYE